MWATGNTRAPPRLTSRSATSISSLPATYGCLVKIGRGTDHDAAEIGEYVLDQHGDEHFVFDNEHTTPGEIPLFIHAKNSLHHLRLAFLSC